MTENLTAWVISQDTAAEIDFFGATEEPGARFLAGDRVAHAEISLRGVPLMLFDAEPGWPATPSHLRVYVDYLDATLAEATKRGAVVFTEPTPMPFGDVFARLRDPRATAGGSTSTSATPVPTSQTPTPRRIWRTPATPSPPTCAPDHRLPACC